MFECKEHGSAAGITIKTRSFSISDASKIEYVSMWMKDGMFYDGIKFVDENLYSFIE